jgi:hypothetical protein
LLATTALLNDQASWNWQLKFYQVIFGKVLACHASDAQATNTLNAAKLTHRLLRPKCTGSQSPTTHAAIECTVTASLNEIPIKAPFHCRHIIDQQFVSQHEAEPSCHHMRYQI